MAQIIIIYIIILTAVGIYDSLRVKSFDDFAAAGKNQGFGAVFMSLMATVLGASATIGIADRAAEIGFAAFWWLGVGAVGLVLQAALLSEKIRSLEASTLPDIAGKTVGRIAEVLLAVIIALSWVGIIAAQFASMAKLLAAVMPGVNRTAMLICISAAVMLYTLFGGQLSVVRTDIIQAAVIFVSIAAALVYVAVKGGNTLAPQDFRLFNEGFGAGDFAELLFITGGAYFLGPDIVSRNLISRDGKTAKRAAMAAAGALVLFSAAITALGMYGAAIMPEGGSPLMYLITSALPKPVGITLCLALASALLSSADTCLINAAAIIGHDILHRDSVRTVRVTVCIISAAALGISLFRSDIIGLLMGAYSVYVPGIVCPLWIALVCYKKRSLCRPLWYAAVAAGGILGLLNTAFGLGGKYLPLLGMALSMLLAALSALIGGKGVWGAKNELCR